MCHFASGVVTRDGRILVGDLWSHEGVGAGLGAGRVPRAYRDRTALLASITEGRKYDWRYTFAGGRVVSIEALGTTVHIGNCPSLTRVEAPEAMNIDVYGCPALISVEAPQATCFDVYDCPSLTHIEAPKGTYYQVYGCPALYGRAT